MLLTRIPRLRNLAVPLLFLYVTLMVTAGPAHATGIDPAGIGDLIPSPDSKVPKGEGTLYETYPDISDWLLDTDYGKWDILDPLADRPAEILMGLIAAIAEACVVVVQWIFKFTTLPPLENSISKSISGAAQGLTETLLPAALAVGGLVVFGKSRESGGGGGGISQIAWMGISGVVSISLLTSPQTWVAGIDTVRQVGSSVTMNATSQGLGDASGDFPFTLDHDPKFTGNGRDDMLRKSADALWRSYVATPWCVAELGSFEACKKYGRGALESGEGNSDERKEWLQHNVNKDTVGDKSNKWRAGHSPIGRLMVTIPAFIAILLFAAIILMLAFTSLASLLGALMLLVSGVFFACLWVIPGRPRQWGLAWFDQLLARTLESMIATLVLGCVLIVQAATTQMFGEYGWLPTSGLSIAAAIVALKFRAVIAQIVGVSGTSGGMLAGMLVSKALGGRRGRRTRAPWPPLPRLGGGYEPLPPISRGGRGDGGPALGAVLSRVRPPAPRPLPPGDMGPALPPGSGGPGPGRGPGGPGAPSVTFDRDRSARLDKTAATIPPPPRRAALPAGSPDGHVTVGQNRPPLPSSSGSMARPEASAAVPVSVSAHPFRQAPPPSAPGGPKVIPATVIRSTPNPPPPRRSVKSAAPPPSRAAAPARRVLPAPPPTGPKPAKEG
ncbi:hypothetical protein CTZ27_35450 [Streptomyces griseocarneus]|nr:hypothetical protein CTZ27_35450 [Streptomyces griseocarneus]